MYRFALNVIGFYNGVAGGLYIQLGFNGLSVGLVSLANTNPVIDLLNPSMSNNR